MKRIVLLASILLFAACKNSETQKDYSDQTLDVVTSIYPENISKIFKAHGTLETWNTFENLIFEIEKPKGNEITSTNLKSRESLIETPTFAIGYNGKQVWLQEKDTTTYKGNAKFYYNLMFYFYAMPYVLADDGIVYTDVEPLKFEGTSYPGIKIGYEAGVGESPEDEYIIYYNKDTHQMEWLGYTVTYFSKEKSKDFHFIKYTNWQLVEGLKLPKTLEWYNYEDGKPTTKRNEMNFTNILLSKNKVGKNTFAMPEKATIIE
jgi:hypothetical protein